MLRVHLWALQLTMSWTRNEVTILLDEYRKWPNLYKIKSANYKNRNLRRRALDSVLSVLKDVKPEVTIQELQAKFQALKQTASKERKKIAASQRSGAGLDDIVESSLWYYKTISYFFDDAEPRLAIDSLDDESQTESKDEKNAEMASEEEEVVVLEILEDDGVMELTSPTVSRPQSSQSTCHPSNAKDISTPSIRTNFCSGKNISNAPTPKGKRKRDESDNVMSQVSSALTKISSQLLTNPSEKTQTKTATQIFGEYVASKLEKITTPDIRDEVEANIISVLNNGLKECRHMNP